LVQEQAEVAALPSPKRLAFAEALAQAGYAQAATRFSPTFLPDLNESMGE